MDTIRSEKLLALILLNQIKEESQALKAQTLDRVGFSNAEIGDLLGTTSAVVSQQLYKLRTSRPRRQQNRRGSAKPARRA